MDKHLITGTTTLTCLLGRPVSHSISPLMHNEAFRLLGLDCVYLCFDVGEDELFTAVSGLKACGARGFNLTMPNKNRILEYLDQLSPAAALIGAVNTVVCEDGCLYGHNTDGIGYMRALRDTGFEIRNQEITVLGAGGAASAIIAQAALDGAACIHVCVRRTSRFHHRMEQMAESIQSSTGCRILLHDQDNPQALGECIASSRLLVNATSVGMAPDTHQTLIRDMSLFRPDLLVSDVIYNPRRTQLLQDAAAHGCRTFNGMYMLLYQGAEAFRLWTGQEMPVEEIRKAYFA